eukprot:482801-Hanusia_phi.AAC.3
MSFHLEGAIVVEIVGQTEVGDSCLASFLHSSSVPSLGCFFCRGKSSQVDGAATRAKLSSPAAIETRTRHTSVHWSLFCVHVALILCLLIVLADAKCGGFRRRKADSMILWQGGIEVESNLRRCWR